MGTEETAQAPRHPRGRSELGAWGEDLAAAHLQAVGMTILDRNWRCRHGEIDILAADGSTLVVCEVKTRTSRDFGTPLAAVTPRKLRRLRRLAVEWLAQGRLSQSLTRRPRAIRFDVVAIHAGSANSPVIEHVRGVG